MAEEILAVAASEKIDLVVVGDKASATGKHWLASSTAEHVLAHAPCSVLIARSPSAS